MPRGMTSIQFPLPHMPHAVATAATSTSDTHPSRQQPTSTIMSTPGTHLLGPGGGGANEGATATKPPSSSSTTPEVTGEDGGDDVDDGLGSVAAGGVTVVPVAKGIVDPVRNSGLCHMRATEKRGGSGVCIVTPAGLLANCSSSYNIGSSASAAESSSLPPNHFNTRTPLVSSLSSTTRTSTATAAAATATADADAATAAPTTTVTKVVGTTSSSVGGNAATMVEETSLIAVMLEEQRRSYRRRSSGGSGSGSGGEVGEGGGGGGGKGALSGAIDARAAADLHQTTGTTTTTTTTTITTTSDSNDGSSSAKPQRPLLPVGGGLGGASGANDDSAVRAGGEDEAEGISGHALPHPLLGGPGGGHQSASTSFSGSGWGSRTAHPMIGVARSKEFMKSSLPAGEGRGEVGNVGRDGGGAGGRNEGGCMGEKSHAAPMYGEHCFCRSTAGWMQDEGSAGGGSAAEAAPLSASVPVPVIVSEGASLPWVGIGGGGARWRGETESGVGGMVGGETRKIGNGQEGMREMRARILHMEAALVRSEVMFACRVNNVYCV